MPPGIVRKDSRSKSYSSDDNRQYEPIHLGDIKRVKSTHLDRKLSNSARIARRQTVIEHQRRRPPGGDAGVSEAEEGQGHSIHTDPEVSMLEFEIIDESEFTNDDDDAAQVERRKSAAPVTLSDLTDKLRITAATNGSPNASLRARSGHGSAHGSQHLQLPSSSNRKRQYLNELSALELFIVKHLAVLMLAPVVSDYFTPEELLDLIGQRKQTLWGRFVKGLKTDKKKSKGNSQFTTVFTTYGIRLPFEVEANENDSCVTCLVEGTFGVPLELLVERNGVDSALGAGPGRIRIPSFVDDSISAMRNMGKVFAIVLHC